MNVKENNEEAFLVTAAKQGNRKAFDELYVRYRNAIADLVYRYLGNYQESEELLQEIFIQGFLNLDKFKIRQYASFFSWLYRIGINMSINYLRRQKSRSESLRYQPPALSPEENSDNPERHVVKMEFEKYLYLGLDQISPRQRMIFVLKHLQDMSIGEIAQLLHCTEGTVRKQLFRGVTKLRKEMSVYRGEKNEM
ncbi:MAG: RNA polymerase sigma factor [Candidatus Aminicenantes bacterium]|nr:RNA polymerase sigma factor [Candidatus Aminicenantes bacterium]